MRIYLHCWMCGLPVLLLKPGYDIPPTCSIVRISNFLNVDGSSLLNNSLPRECSRCDNPIQWRTDLFYEGVRITVPDHPGWYSLEDYS